MNGSAWQHPLVNVFKHFDIGSTKKCAKQGDVTALMDRDLKSTVFRIRGLVPANNFIQFPAQLANQNLSLTGQLFYVLFRPVFDKFFSIHIDILTHEQHIVRISVSNLFHEFKATQTSIQFPYTTNSEDVHWTMLCLDLESILLTHMTNQHYHMIKSIQLCGNMLVKNCFSSKFLYEPASMNHTAKQAGLKCTGMRALPRELSFPLNKGESWHEKYDFIMIPHPTSTEKNPSVRIQTPSEINGSAHDDESISNQQTSRSLTDVSQMVTQRSNISIDQQSFPERFSSLPSIPEISHRSSNDGIHLFVKPQSVQSNNSMHDDLSLGTSRSQMSNLERNSSVEPLLRLRTIIGLGSEQSFPSNFIWTNDGNYLLYPTNAIVVQMHLETRQQSFFIGHTDKVSGIAFNGNSSLLATTQTGPDGVLRLWKFETRQCICVVRVPGACQLHALDFGLKNLSDASTTLVVVGQGEQPHQSKTVVCVYNTINVHKGSIELISRTTTDSSISRIRFVPYDSTRFMSIGSDNIRFWRLKNGNDLKSMSISVDDIHQLEYTDLQFEHFSSSKLNELVVFISSKSGHIIEILYDERRVIKIHRLLPNKRPSGSADKITMANGPSIGISALTCTSQFCLTGSNDGYVRVWSNDFTQVFMEAKHDQAISALATSPDQTRVAISTVSGSLGLLNLLDKQHIHLIRAHTARVNDIDYDDNRKQLISVAEDGTIRTWCFRTAQQLSEFTAEREIPTIVTFSPNRQVFACGFDNGTIKIFQLNNSTISNQITHHTTKITGLLYAHHGGRLLTTDFDGNLSLFDADDNYKLQRTISKALLPSSQHNSTVLSISPDGKHTAYVGPNEFIVTVVETNSLNQTLRIDISSCTLMLNDRKLTPATEFAIFVQYAPNRELFVATNQLKLLKFDSFTGKLLNIINSVHKRSFDCLALTSDSQFLVTAGDEMLKFWNELQFQSFVGHSQKIRKVFFTDDNMNVVSIGDSIFIWDVLAWTTPRPDYRPPPPIMGPVSRSNGEQNGQPRAPPEPFQYIQPKDEKTARAITKSVSNSELEKNSKKATTKRNAQVPSIRRHFIQRENRSQLAKKRYVAPTNQETLRLQSIVGYNGCGRENLVWHAHSGFFSYTVGCNVIVENLNNNHQSILIGHSEEISTICLSNDVSLLASAQCSNQMVKDEVLTKIIVWDVKTLKQKLTIHQPVFAIQCLAFSKDDRFLSTVGDYRRPQLTLWSTQDFTSILTWEDDSSSNYINCFTWNPLRANEFSLAGSKGIVRFCTIVEANNENEARLQVVNGLIPTSISENSTKTCEITSCAYLFSSPNLVLFATNLGFVTCWNSRSHACLLHWKADGNEISYMTTIKNQLITGSSTGCLRLWNTESLESSLVQTSRNESNYGLSIQDEFQLDDGVISGAFDDTFDMGIVGTSAGSIWYICWTSDRSKTRLVASHTDRITGLIPIEDTHVVTSSLDGTIRIFQLDDRNEILRFDAQGLKVTAISSWDNAIVPTSDLSSTTTPIKNIRTAVRSVVAGYHDGTLRVFNLVYGQMVSKLHPHTAAITTIHIPSTANVCICGGSDGSISISDLVQGIVVRVLNEHRGNAPICSIDSMKIVENNSFIWLAASHDRRVSLWKSNEDFGLCQIIDWLTFSAPSFPPDGNSSSDDWPNFPPSLARFVDRNSLVYIGYGIEKSVQIYNIQTKQILRTSPLSQWCSAFDLSIDEKNGEQRRLIAIGTKDRLLQLRDLTQGTFQDFVANSDTIRNVRFVSNKNNSFLITTASNEIFIWKILLN